MTASPAPVTTGAATGTGGVRPGHLDVDRRTDLALDARDAGAIAAILRTRPETGLFLTRAWLTGFVNDPPRGIAPSVLLFRARGAVRGLVPIAVRDGRLHAHVTLLGGGLGSDRVDLVAERGSESACADTFLAWLHATFGRRGFVLSLRDVPAESPIWGAIERARGNREHTAVLLPQAIHAAPYLDLSGPQATHREDPLTGASNSLDKHRRWLERRGAVSADVLTDPNEVLSAFNLLVDFLHARWHGAGGSALDDPRSRRFHRSTILRLLDAGALRMLRLSVDGRAVAVCYGLAFDNWRAYYLAGYDREWAGRIHLGRIVIEMAIEGAIAEGAAVFDFLKGAEPAKYFWPVRERATLDANLASARFGPQMDRARLAMRDGAAALARSAYRW